MAHLVLARLYWFLFCCCGLLLFPIVELKNAIAQLQLVRLTQSKVCYVLAYTWQPCLRDHLGGGASRFGAFVLIFVLLLWTYVVPHWQTQKCNCSASTGLIDHIQSLLCVSIYRAIVFWVSSRGWHELFWNVCSGFCFSTVDFCCSPSSDSKMHLLSFNWSDWPNQKFVMY